MRHARACDHAPHMCDHAPRTCDHMPRDIWWRIFTPQNFINKVSTSHFQGGPPTDAHTLKYYWFEDLGVLFHTHFGSPTLFFIGFLDHLWTKPTHIFIKARFKGIRICISYVIFNLSTRTTWESYEAKASKTQNKLSKIWGLNNHFCTFILSHCILFYCCQQLRNYCDLCGETGNLHAHWIIYAHINCHFASSSSDMWENHIVLHFLHLDLHFIIKNKKI